ncbi:transmembrane protein 265 [Pseudophryne corroboree]|uniref:transmembrane protein 265 n=1 Tax=Pseudophryne corroboree TaxID=495146 RepID=UPI003081D8ED
MPETQELQILAASGEQTLQNGSVEEIKVLIDKHDPSQQPSGFNQQSPSDSGETHCRHFSSCSLRRLAIMSIVCGVSCIGIKALILALRAEQEKDQPKHELLSRRSRKFSVLSIAVFLGALVCLPFLVVFISYIMTLIE